MKAVNVYISTIYVYAYRSSWSRSKWSKLISEIAKIVSLYIINNIYYLLYIVRVFWRIKKRFWPFWPWPLWHTSQLSGCQAAMVVGNIASLNPNLCKKTAKSGPWTRVVRFFTRNMAIWGGGGAENLERDEKRVIFAPSTREKTTWGQRDSARSTTA